MNTTKVGFNGFLTNNIIKLNSTNQSLYGYGYGYQGYGYRTSYDYGNYQTYSKYNQEINEANEANEANENIEGENNLISKKKFIDSTRYFVKKVFDWLDK